MTDLKITKKILTVLLAVLISLSSAYPAFSAEEIKEDVSVDETVIVDMNRMDKMSSDSLIADPNIVRSAKYSAKWEKHDEHNFVGFPVSLTDWREYDSFRFWAYSEKATNATISVIVYCKQRINGMVYIWSDFKVNWTGWKLVTIDLSTFNTTRYGSIAEVESLEFWATGWNSSGATEDTVIYFDNIMLGKENIRRNPVPQTSEEFKAVRKAWKENLIGKDVDLTKDGVKSKIKAIEKDAESAWKIMNTDEKTPCLWTPGTGYGKPKATSTMSFFYTNIRYMALAYATPGSKYYHDSMLKSDILFAIDWMYENMFGPDEMRNQGWRDTTLVNWWDWQIGSPKELVDILILMDDALSDVQLKKYVAPVEYFTPQSSQTAANKASIAYAILASSVISENQFRFMNGRNAIESLLYFSDTVEAVSNSMNEGFFTDGSFLYHGKHAMNGSYGIEQIKCVSPVISILGNTDFGISADKINIVKDWIYQSYEPINFNGSIMSIATGRYPENGRSAGVNEMSCVLDVLPAMDEENQAKMKSYVKFTVENDTINDYFKELKLSQLGYLESILNDENVKPRENYNISKIYGMMDKAVWRRNGYSAGLSMSSSRIYNYESISGCNQTGWYMGDGMLLLYSDNDMGQFEGDYWTTANKYRLPGTTVDNRERQKLSIANEEAYLSSKDFVGGATLGGEFMVAAMDLESFHSEGKGTLTDPIAMSQPKHENDLVANKAYFMFDNEIVALGNGITSTMNADVETIVDNRKLDTDKKVTINGKDVEKTEKIQYADYISIDGIGGYYFPVAAKLGTKRGNFLEAWFVHGKNPENATYEYVVLPGMTEREIEAYKDNPDISVLSNTPEIQAVSEKNTGICGYVFRTAGEFNNVSVSAPSVVMVREINGECRVSVADPTHKLTGVTVKIPKKNLENVEKTENISVENSGEHTVITVNTENAKGNSFEVIFR